MRTTMFQEPIKNVLLFADSNSENFNDIDFSEFMTIIANKIENDVFKRINLNIFEGSPSYAALKRHIQANFDRILSDNYLSSNLLSLYSQLYLRNKSAYLFTQEQCISLVESNFNNLISSHSKMSTVTLLNQISNLLIHKNILNLQEIMKPRVEEISTLSFALLNRLIRRTLNDKVSDSNRDNFTKFLNNDLLNLATGEKMINKCRAFNTLVKLNSTSPFHIVSTQKLNNLLKDIRAQSENHDQQSIILMIEALNIYDEVMKNEALKETCDIVIMTIKHLEENVKLEFVMKFIENVSESPSSILNHEQLSTLFKYVTTQLNQIAASNGRVPSILILVHSFTLMKKTKFYDKDSVTAILTAIEPYYNRLGSKDDLSAMKLVVAKIFGEEKVASIEDKIIESYLLDKDKYDNAYTLPLISRIGRVSKFANINLEKTKKYVSELTDKCLTLIKAESVPPITTLQRYIEIQDYLSYDLKLKFVSQILETLPDESIPGFKYIEKFLVNMTLLQIKNESEELKAIIHKKIDIASSDPRFKNNFAKILYRLAKDDSDKINNHLLHKFSMYLREFSKSPEFIQENMAFPKYVNIIVNLIFNMDKKASYNYDGIQSISYAIENLYIKADSPSFDLPRFKLPQIIKFFDRARINLSILKKPILSYFENDKIVEKNYLTGENILLLDRLIRSDNEEESIIKILQRYFPNTEKTQNLLNEANSPRTKLSLIKLLIAINKKFPSIIPDEMIVTQKDFLWNNMIKGDFPEIVKLDALCVLSFVKSSVFRFNSEKENISLIREIVSSIPLRKCLRSIELLSSSSFNRLSRRLMIEISSLYEKEANIDKVTLIKILEKFTYMGWNSPNFYNKVIIDYEKNFDFLSSMDQMLIVSYFARVEFNKEDVVSAAIKNTNIKFLGDANRFDLFNNLVTLGFTNQEWKETCLEKIISSTDMNSAFQKSLPRDKIKYLNNLWKLGDGLVKIKELVKFY
jgi:hypothetical protein